MTKRQISNPEKQRMTIHIGAKDTSFAFKGGRKTTFDHQPGKGRGRYGDNWALASMMKRRLGI